MSRVLCVDDNPDILHLVELRLTGKGHTVLSAASGPEALAMLDGKADPDLAVLDVSMPGMDGFALLSALRARDGLAELPAIFLSARVQPQDIEAGRALGATYLTKPFVASALFAAVERALPRAAAAGW